MAESETKQVYVFCDKCKENVSLDITDDDIESSKTGLTTVISVHGTPQHAILVYLDKNLKARGVEYPSVLQVQSLAPSGRVMILQSNHLRRLSHRSLLETHYILFITTRASERL
ncbi:MAG: hypothetical protein ACXACE_03965 [Candidatus Thorarchaeota archaeon]